MSLEDRDTLKAEVASMLKHVKSKLPKKEEAKYRADFVKSIRLSIPSALVFRHEDIRTAGIPDISISRGGRTVWVETKANKFESKGLQFENLRRLSGFYVVFSREGTVIADPVTLGVIFFVGTDFYPAVERIRKELGL